MTPNKDPRTLLFAANGGSWLSRIVVFMLAATIAVLAFFFLTIALIAGTLLAVAIGLRWWWLTRKLRASAEEHAFEGEYTVIEHSEHEHGAGPRHGRH
ncbi:MAG TPA: hypothetical protein VLT92_18235 [Burkholderiales bacterium]|nr:hypothetical protein [Burkholderiales bacterium]